MSGLIAQPAACGVTLDVRQGSVDSGSLSTAASHTMVSFDRDVEKLDWFGNSLTLYLSVRACERERERERKRERRERQKEREKESERKGEKEKERGREREREHLNY